jgi:squalene synthase HpnC
MIVGAADRGAPTGAVGAPPSAASVMRRAPGENFPVAMRLLREDQRAHLLALYGFARLVDQLGDEVAGDRLAALDWLERELEQAYSGQAEHPLMRRLAPTLRACELPRGPFLRLIEANRVDQRRQRYETWAQLREYCALSANPVGELVLGVFGLVSPARLACSDDVCTALQLLEHCQDVGEDYARGRIYLPAEDLERFDCRPGELGARRTGAALRRLLAFELARTRNLLDQGSALVGMLRGRPRLAVAGFIGGGRAAAAAVASADYDVLAAAPRPTRARTLLAIVFSLTPSRR